MTRASRLLRLHSIAWLLLPMFAACVAYRAAPIDVDRLPASYADRRLDEAELRAFVASFCGREPATWPQQADLSQCTAVALFHRPELRVARAQVAAAVAAREIAGQLPNPKLSVGPGFVANPGDQTRWLLVLGLNFPLELFGQRGAREQAAASEATAAKLALARVDLAVRAEVVERVLALQAAREVAAATAEQAVLRNQVVSISDQRVAAGVADAIEIAAVRAAAQRAGLAKAEAAQAVVAARGALAATLGLPPAALDELTLPPLPDELPALDDSTRVAAEAAVRRRLDVAEALCAYASREAALRLEVAKQWPDFELGPGYEYDQGLQKFHFDLGFTLPLFHGNGAAIEQATAARAAAAAAVEAAQTKVLTDVDSARLEFAQQREQWSLARTLAATTAASAVAIEARAAIGIADQREVLASRLEASDARATSAQRHAGAVFAWVRLEAALQQPVGSGLIDFTHTLPEEKP